MQSANTFFFFVQEGWGQTSRELFPQLPPVRAALSPGFWALYLTSRQDFVWSQGCNIIPAHSPVVSWQSGWAHYREQNEVPFDSVLGCSLWNPTFTPHFRQCLHQSTDCRAVLGRQTGSTALIHWKFYFLGLINPWIPSCLSTGAQVWVLGGSLYTFLLC